MQKKKKQHYVWKEYLKNWTNDKYINTVLLRANLKTKLNLMNTSMENHFYALPDFSEQDFSEITQIVNDHASDFLRPQIMKIISAVHENNNLLQDFESSAKDYAELQRVNMIEDFFTSIEEIGKKLIHAHSVAQITELLEDKVEYFNILLFISFQYVRTKKMKKNLLEGLNKKRFYKEKFWIIFQIIYGFEIAVGLSVRKKIKLNFLVINGCYNFITSDNPIFNLLGNDRNEDGWVKSLKLYYPLNTKIALIISSSDKNQIEKTIINESKVKIFNQKVYRNALENVYFMDKNDLLSL